MGTGAIKVGLSARFLAPSPDALGLRGKPIQFLETSVAKMLSRAGALVFLIPAADEFGWADEVSYRADDYANSLDALVLQGGIDISPCVYGGSDGGASRGCDLKRDLYELALVDAFIREDKPVLGICRGMQLLNVYFGGALCQDIRSEIASEVPHVSEHDYDRNYHDVELPEGSYLSSLYGANRGRVISIHHQCVGRLGDGLKVEALSPVDGVVEAIRSSGENYVMGVQWHPEFHDPKSENVLCSEILVGDFVRCAARRRLGSATVPPISFVN